MLHEKLDCYRQSVDIAGELGKEMAGWPRGFGFLADQLRRAMASVVLNMAEGNGRLGSRERRRFFQIARASVAEVAACVDLMRAYLVISEARCNELKSRLDRVSRMLYRLH